MKVTKELAKLTTTQSAMARLLKMSTARANQLTQEGTFVLADDKGGIFVIESVMNYARRDDSRKKQAADVDNDSNIDFNIEHARLEKLKADKEEIRVAKLRGELYEAKTVELVMQEIYTTLRTQLLGIPTKLAARLPEKLRGQVSEALTQEIEGCLSEMSSYDPEMFTTEDDGYE